MGDLILIFCIASFLIIFVFGILLLTDYNSSKKEDKVILGIVILCIVFLMITLSTNFIFANKKETVYTDIEINNVIRRGELYYFIKTKNKSLLFHSNELKFGISDSNSLVVKTKYPKIQILSLPEYIRSDYILNIKQ